MRVFSTFFLRSNKNMSCMRIDESWQAGGLHESFLNFLSSFKQEHELHEN